MNAWADLSPRLRLAVLGLLTVVAVASWLALPPATSKSVAPPRAVTNKPQPTLDQLPLLSRMQLQQSLQRPGLKLQQLSFTADQAQVQLQSQWQPFAELVRQWAVTSHGPVQYQLQFDNQLVARVQLARGRFRAAPALPTSLPELLPRDVTAVAVKPIPAAPVATCTAAPPPVALAALWPTRGYALVQHGQSIHRVQTGEEVADSGWKATAITASALHLQLNPAPEGCNEPPRYALRSAQNQ